MSNLENAIYSNRDILEIFQQYVENNDVEEEPILYFISELTGYSIDKISEIITDMKEGKL